jgi:hypothetical protein
MSLSKRMLRAGAGGRPWNLRTELSTAARENRRSKWLRGAVQALDLNARFSAVPSPP